MGWTKEKQERLDAASKEACELTGERVVLVNARIGALRDLFIESLSGYIDSKGHLKLTCYELAVQLLSLADRAIPILDLASDHGGPAVEGIRRAEDEEFV